MDTSITSNQVTDGQRKQLKRFAEDAIDRAIAEIPLDKDGAQKLIEKGGEFQAEITNSIGRLSTSSRFTSEEVVSNSGYFSGYKPKSVAQQSHCLCGLVPGIGSCDMVKHPLPIGAEGWFVIPKWQKVAPTYTEAVQKVLGMIKEARCGNFHNHREGRINPDHLRQSGKTEKMFQIMGDQQKDCDALVVACQFGFRHRGRSNRRAIETMNNTIEFGLDAFSIGIMILTHPERLQHCNDLGIDCAGDEFSENGNGQFKQAPYFHFGNNAVEFGTSFRVDAYSNYGSASGFASSLA